MSRIFFYRKNYYAPILKRSIITSTSWCSFVAIGDIKIKKYDVEDKNKQFVPKCGKFAKLPNTQENLGHFRWMMQKEALKQDFYLLGPPSPYKRRLVLNYSELVNREIEMVTISHDTSESDLKQRREIVNGTVVYVDQAPVRAAMNGRLLVLDGIEKAERNVLPTLNNLLENREMMLDDGTFLVNPQRYNMLLQSNTKEELDAKKLIKTHENFLVVALGLPVPAYPGFPIDPPFRSRFQGRLVSRPKVEIVIRSILDQTTNLKQTHLRKLVGFWNAINIMEMEMKGMSKPPHFSIEMLMGVCKTLDRFPNESLKKLVRRFYPYHVQPNEVQSTVEFSLKQFGLFQGNNDDSDDNHAGYYVGLEQLKVIPSENNNFKTITLSSKNSNSNNNNNSNNIVLRLPSGTLESRVKDDFVKGFSVDSTLCGLLQDHFLGKDLCIIARKGDGKTAFVNYFAELLGYEIETVYTYKDMTTRDIIQKRTTDEFGNTKWEMTSLIRGAVEGSLVVLDGIHRLPRETLFVLHQLIFDRTLTLFDGSRLIDHESYQMLKDKGSNMDKIRRIHPSFRIIATAAPYEINSNKSNWLESETIGLFTYHEVSLNDTEFQKNILNGLYPSLPLSILSSLLKFSAEISELEGGAQQYLSIRQLARICRRAIYYPEDIHQDINRTCMTQFFPIPVRESFNNALDNCGFSNKEKDNEFSNLELVDDGNKIMIGGIEMKKHKPKNPELVPHILFFDIPSHLYCLREIIKDLANGESHILLIGNQGTGKNKLVDRLLMILNMEREYIQLHRDTTIQTLTLAPSLQDGVIVWNDSPLVKAVQEGRCLVIDEADKAPLEVVCILKGLVEDGEMLLADGRKIVRNTIGHKKENIIPIHPEFKLFVLANRPGFPFLGNDFFAECGDVFSCHVIANPDKESEKALLRSYAPHVSEHSIEKLVNSFNEIREMVQEGMLTYPYSTRELVNILLHMNNYPNDGIATVLANVFSFESFENNKLKTVREVMDKHGLPIIQSTTEYNLVEPRHEKLLESTQIWMKTEKCMASTVLNNIFTVHKRNAGFMFGNIKDINIEMVNNRVHEFSEILQTLKPNEIIGTPSRLVNLNDKSLHMLCVKPCGLYSFNGENYSNCQYTELSFVTSNAPVMLYKINNKLLFVAPAVGYIFVIENNFDEPNASYTGFEIPETFTGKRQRLQITRPAIEYKFSVLESANLCLLYKSKSTCELLLVDLENFGGNHITFEIKEKIDRAWLISKNEILIKFCGTITIFSYNVATLKLHEIQLEHKSEEVQANTINFSDILIQDDKIYFTGNSEFLFLEGRASDNNNEFDLNGVKRSEEIQLDRSEISVHPVFIEDSALILPQTKGDFKIVELPASTRTLVLPDINKIIKKKNTTAAIVDFAVAQNNNAVVLLQNGHLIFYQWNYKDNVESMQEWLSFRGVNKEDNLKLQYENDLGQVFSEDFGEQGGGTEVLRMVNVGDGSIGGDGSGGGGGGGGSGGGATGSGGGGGQGADKKSDGFGGFQRDEQGNILFQEIVQHIEEDTMDALDPEVKKQMARKTSGQAPSAHYEQLMNKVEKEILQLRVIFEGVEAKEHEREWLTNQNAGELDDSKIVDGVAGERFIYKKRGEPEKQLGLHQMRPKRLKFVVDLSASMARFNGWDQRLDRQAEICILIIESFAGFEHKYDYSIVGHSGSGADIPLVDFGKPPKEMGDKMDLITKMYGYANGAVSGDTTLEATQLAINSVFEEEADDYFVFIVSDANLGRYDVSPKQFGEVLKCNPKVNSYAIFIAEKGAADYMKKGMPYGHVFVCISNNKFPTTFKDIFIHASHN